jgi:hypothetical protein
VVLVVAFGLLLVVSFFSPFAAPIGAGGEALGAIVRYCQLLLIAVACGVAEVALIGVPLHLLLRKYHAPLPAVVEAILLGCSAALVGVVLAFAEAVLTRSFPLLWLVIALPAIVVGVVVPLLSRPMSRVPVISIAVLACGGLPMVFGAASFFLAGPN